MLFLYVFIIACIAWFYWKSGKKRKPKRPLKRLHMHKYASTEPVPFYRKRYIKRLIARLPYFLR